MHLKMDINRTDVIWNYAATFLKIAASSLLLPFILKLMPSETVGIWSVFVTVNSLIILLDFGFNPSFARNITYTFSGVQNLQSKGYSLNDVQDISGIDYGLLKGIISAMKWFYLRVAAILFLLLSTVGTYYIYNLLKKYHGDHQEVYIAWALLCIINSFNLSSLYYDSLLQGKGLIKQSRQIVIISQIVYLVVAVILIFAGKGLIAIVAAQGSSVIIVRWLSHRLFFSQATKTLIAEAYTRSRTEILQAVYPNALKAGLTTFGGVMVQRSAIIIGSLYLSLEQIASYGITMQIIALIAGLSGIYINTYQAKIVQLRIKDDKKSIKNIYIKGQFVFMATYTITGSFLLLFGNLVLNTIGSQTQLLPSLALLAALFLSFEQTNFLIAGNILSTKNEIPFFKSSIVAGIVIVIGLIVSFVFFESTLWVLLVIPIIIDLTYQAWKWPLEVAKDLKIGILRSY